MRRFTSLVSLALAAALLLPVTAQAAPAGATISDDGVTFTQQQFFTDLTGQVIPAVPVSDGPAMGGGAPAHLRFAFDEDVLPEYTAPTLRQVLIYPVSELRSLDIEIGKEIDALAALIAERPATISGTIPLLPPMGAMQVFHAQARYLDFANGAGVRFVSKYAQDASPVTNQDAFYTFQGLTADGLYYISFFHPISTTVLPNSVDETEAATDYNAFAENYTRYMSETVQALDAAAPGDFTPDLAQLDAFVQSIVIGKGVGRELAGKRFADIKAQTEVIRYVPAAAPKETQSGSCFANSLAAQRADTWRCMVDNSIYDPCFTAKGGKIVCGIDPRWPDNGFTLKLTKRLPKASIPAAVKAAAARSGWRFELTDGTVCSPMTGATGLVGDDRINYGCTGGFVIAGDLATGATWTATKIVIASEGEGKFTAAESYPVVIKTVWQ